MAHYAFLDSHNKVTHVIVGIDENELIEGKEPEIWYGEFANQKCVRTSFNGKIRGKFAGIGDVYVEEEDIFVSPQPFPSWTRDGIKWIPPIEKPDGYYYWDEIKQDWLEY